MGKLGWFMSDLNRNIPTSWSWTRGDSNCEDWLVSTEMVCVSSTAEYRTSAGRLENCKTHAHEHKCLHDHQCFIKKCKVLFSLSVTEKFQSWYINYRITSEGAVIKKVASSNPAGAAREFSSQESTLCADSYSVSFHPRVTAVARKRPRSFCQKCR